VQCPGVPHALKVCGSDKASKRHRRAVRGTCVLAERQDAQQSGLLAERHAAQVRSIRRLNPLQAHPTPRGAAMNFPRWAGGWRAQSQRLPQGLAGHWSRCLATRCWKHRSRGEHQQETLLRSNPSGAATALVSDELPAWEIGESEIDDTVFNDLRAVHGTYCILVRVPTPFQTLRHLLLQSFEILMSWTSRYLFLTVMRTEEVL